MLPLLTRLYPQEIYGAWLQILLISEFLSEILGLRLGTAIVRYLSREKNPKMLICAVFTVTLSLSMLFVVTSFVLGEWLSEIIFDSQNLKSLFLTAAVWILITACMKIGLSVLRAYEKIGLVSAREFISVVWLTIAVCCAYFFKLDLQRLVLLCAVGDMFLLIWILFEIGTPFPIISISKRFGIMYL